MKEPLILGVDTSCDDTAVGIVRGREVLANVVASQSALHERWGGVVPEQASREHLRVMDGVLGQALEDAQLNLEDIDVFAATYGPGLVGALLVGLSYTKALAWSRGRPFIPVHHLEGHLAGALVSENLSPPFLALLVSGGHTVLFNVPDLGVYHELGRSRDDAAGEAFDKVARLLGLGFPGGPALSRLAAQGNDAAFAFTLPLKGQTAYDFSFSGLKTAVALLLKNNPDVKAEDVAASFERTVVESLVSVTARALVATGHQQLVVAGGVAANQRLREAFKAGGIAAIFPPLALATDNGAMIALAAQHHLAQASNWAVDASPYLPLVSHA